MDLYRKLKERNSIWKFKILKQFLFDNENILDFGCGDLGLSSQIVKNFRKVQITGVDVIPLKKVFKKNKRVKFIKYDGKNLPFKKNAFDITIAFYVFHHCENPEELIKECIRVTKKRILVVESIPHHQFELTFMKFFDWVFNIAKFDMTPLPYKFYTLKKWKELFKKYNTKNTKTYHPKGIEDILPFGKMYLLEFEKIKK